MRGQPHAPAALYLQERPGTNCTGGCVVPRKYLVPIVQEAVWSPDTVWTSAENLAPHWDSNPCPSSL